MEFLRVRAEQLAVLDAQAALRYELRLVRFLQEQFPEAAAIPAAELRSGVAAQVSKARRYGLRSEREIAAYVVTAWLLGPAFDTGYPAASEVLASQLPGEAKTEFLEIWTREIFERLEIGNRA